jgi:hypothetical protein
MRSSWWAGVHVRYELAGPALLDDVAVTSRCHRTDGQAVVTGATPRCAVTCSTSPILVDKTPDP